MACSLAGTTLPLRSRRCPPWGAGPCADRAKLDIVLDTVERAGGDGGAAGTGDNDVAAGAALKPLSTCTVTDTWSTGGAG